MWAPPVHCQAGKAVTTRGIKKSWQGRPGCHLHPRQYKQWTITACFLVALLYGPNHYTRGTSSSPSTPLMIISSVDGDDMYGPHYYTRGTSSSTSTPLMIISSVDGEYRRLHSIDLEQYCYLWLAPEKGRVFISNILYYTTSNKLYEF